jgi:GNAT superfamily N-acetyltransferase
MMFVDRELSQRLERTEGYTCAQYAAARRTLFPASGAEWMEHAGAYAAFDGRDSPITQSFALGVSESEPLSPAILDTFEQFFLSRGARVEHEISPFAGAEAMDLLCARGYRPIEISSMLYQTIAADAVAAEPRADVQVRVIDPAEADVWTDICVRGWAPTLPDAQDVLRDIGTIGVAREGTLCFLASIDGTPGAAGMLCLHEGVALFGGATTVPELRRRGLQAALLRERMRHAREAGCDLAMIVAPPGSDSQRNAERTGFRLAYTRTKWRLPQV